MQEKNKLYVGNLPWSIDDEGLAKIFSDLEDAEVIDAKVIMDKFSGKSKGFGFVTLSTEEAADKAVAKYNNMEVDGRQIFVNIARPQEERSGSSAGGKFQSGGSRNFRR